MKAYISLFFGFALSLILMQGCDATSSGGSSDLVEAKIKNSYSMMIPSNMTSTKELHDEASLQYMNELKELYVIVIDEEKDSIGSMLEELEGLEVFNKDRTLVGQMMDLQMLNMRMSSTIAEEQDEESLKVGQFDAMRKELVATVPGINESVGYFLTMIEGKNHVYTVMQWTLASEKDNQRQMFKDMVQSFKEL